MSNEHLLHDLDRRAASASRDLRARAEARVIPPFKDDLAVTLAAPSTMGSRSHRPLLSIAAALLLVVGAAVWFSVGGGDDETSRANTVDAPRPFEATDLPEGLQAAYFASPVRDSGEALSSGPLALFGTSTERPELGLVYLPGFDPAELEGLAPVDFGKRTAYDVGTYGLGQNTLIVPEGGGAVAVLAPSLSRDDVRGIISGFVLDDETVTVPDRDLPDGWHFLGSEPRGFDVVSPTAALSRGATSSYFAMYAGAERATLTVRSGPGSELTVAAVGLLSTDVRALTVRGQPGVLTRTPVDPSNPTETLLTLAWMESPGEVIQVSGVGVSDEELLVFAEGLRPVERAAWADLVRRSDLGEFQPYDDLVDGVSYRELGSGQFLDGTAWRLEVGTGPDLESDSASTRLHVAVEDNGSGQSSGSSTSGSPDPDQAFVSTETLDRGGRHFASGLIGDTVDTVQLRRPDGSLISRTELVEADGYRAWVGELTEDPTVVVALDAAGEELDRVTFDDLEANESPEISEGGPGPGDPESPGG